MRCFATAISIVLFSLLTISTASLSSNAQTFTVLHQFTGGRDGAQPLAGLTIDAPGNLYGTATGGGTYGHGAVFKLAHHKGSGWLFTPLYSFAGGNDGAYPLGGVITGPDGGLYGTTELGGVQNCNNGCGTVFKLRPSPRACTTALCSWTETVLYRFQAGSGDGYWPTYEDLIFDQAGSIYGTTVRGGAYGAYPDGYGTLFKLTPFNGGWTESVLYSFGGANGGLWPLSGVIFDETGNIYGTTDTGGLYGYGTVYQLTPSGDSWTENDLHSFSLGSDGGYPYGAVIFDQPGNLYGPTYQGGVGYGPTIWQLSPVNGGWDFAVLHSFSNTQGNPLAGLVMDTAGNLYGTSAGPGYSGSVFKLTPSSAGWIYNVLYEFTGGSDGANPYGSVTLDANGNLYGTAFYGGTGGACDGGCGVVWEITP